ncbi:Formate dehydrogenase H [Ruegeria sp. THAF57]|nr:Formate dehydrogenase H [Ruegeria sp. THAF57]
MRRVGSKGEGRFARISWDEALAEVGDRLNTISNEFGPEKIFNTHYTGTCSLVAMDFPNRFFSHLGATEVNPDTICNAAGHTAWTYVFGDSANGFDPRTAKESSCILIWGANPSSSAPHVGKNWLNETDAKIVVVDPVRHETAIAADLHLQPRPGSDAALAFAMAHVLQRDGLLDNEYISAHVLGYDEVAEDITNCTPEWGERETGVPAALIEDAAKAYGRGPSVLWLGQGLQRQPSGGNIFRSCAMLAAISGNIGKPGAGAYYLNMTFDIAIRSGKSPDYEALSEVRDGCSRSVSQMDLPSVLNDAEAAKAYFVWNCNPAASNPSQTELRKALERDDLFTVVADCFLTDTAKYADIVLPAASFLEFDDLTASYFHLTIGPQVKVSEPMGEALPNQEIFRRLAKEMGLQGEELYQDDQSIIDEMLRDCDIGLDWEGLKAKGWSYISEEPLDLWSDGKFATPSGKIEISSARAAEDGLPRTPQPESDPAPADGFFRLLSPAEKHLMNSSYGNDTRIRNMMGDAHVTIHPDDARALGVVDGEGVVLFNSIGEVPFVAKVEDDVPQGTLLTHKSRWPSLEPSNVNVNFLHLPRKSDMGESSSVHGTEVKLRKA